MNQLNKTDLESQLIFNLKSKSEELQALFESVSDHWGYEDAIYRFYHQSFKLFRLQSSKLIIVEMLQSLLPGRSLNPWFQEIVDSGTGMEFTPETNDHWLQHTRPIVEAFLHGRYFLEMACRYSEPPEGPTIPSGWAALLTLYQIR